MKNERPYPENLLFAILDQDIEIVKDNIDGLVFAVSTLTAREQYILSERYISTETLEFIGQASKVSRERVRQIEAKALRKLRHPSRKQYILKGLSVIEAVNKLREELHDKELVEILYGIKAEFEENQLSQSSLEKNMKLSIEYCNFSVRTYNCLKHAGYNTIADIIKAPKSKLQTIRNLGNRSYCELEDYIKSLGLEIGE